MRCSQLLNICTLKDEFIMTELCSCLIGLPVPHFQSTPANQFLEFPRSIYQFLSTFPSLINNILQSITYYLLPPSLFNSFRVNRSIFEKLYLNTVNKFLNCISFQTSYYEPTEYLHRDISTNTFQFFLVSRTCYHTHFTPALLLG